MTRLDKEVAILLLVGGLENRTYDALADRSIDAMRWKFVVVLKRDVILRMFIDAQIDRGALFNQPDDRIDQRFATCNVESATRARSLCCNCVLCRRACNIIGTTKERPESHIVELGRRRFVVVAIQRGVRRCLIIERFLVMDSPAKCALDPSVCKLLLFLEVVTHVLIEHDVFIIIDHTQKSFGRRIELRIMNVELNLWIRSEHRMASFEIVIVNFGGDHDDASCVFQQIPFPCGVK